MSYGLYLNEYSAWYVYESKSFDPRLLMNLPSVGVWFSSRDTKY